jgi:hypothetical protein
VRIVKYHILNLFLDLYYYYMMSSDNDKEFLSTLLSIYSKPMDERWDLFLHIVQKFKPVNNNYIRSVAEFDELVLLQIDDTLYTNWYN